MRALGSSDGSAGGSGGRPDEFDDYWGDEAGGTVPAFYHETSSPSFELEFSC